MGVALQQYCQDVDIARMEALWSQWQLSRADLAPATRRSDLYVLRFCRDMNVDAPDRITASSMIMYQQNRTRQGVSPRTINETHRLVAQFCDYLVDMGLLDANPVRRVRRLKGRSVHYRRALTVEEIHALCRVSPPRYARMWRAYLCMGVRLMELVYMTAGDLDIANATCYLPGERTKTRNARYVVMGPRTAIDLDGYAEQPSETLLYPNRDGRPHSNNLLKRLQYWCGRAGIDLRGVDMHALRATYATLIYDACPDVDNRTAEALMGHGVIRTGSLLLTKYARPRVDRLREVAEKVEELVYELVYE